MENIKSMDEKILVRITEQLSELNQKLSGENNKEFRPRENGKGMFLFGFELNGAATAEEYRKYFAFLETITSVLDEFGIHMGNNGYAYIMDAVKIIIDRETYDLRLKTDIYPLIAARYRIRRQDAIEHNIRNAINTAYEENIKTPGINSMGMFRKKPTNKQFLIFVADSVTKCAYRSMIRTAS